MGSTYPRYEWGGVCCDTDRARANVHSWFAPFVPAAWGLPLKCDLQEDTQTGREVQFRALYRRADGRLMEAIRRNNARSVKLTTRPASPGILKDWREA